MRAPLALAVAAALAAIAPHAGAVEIDGRIDPAEWQGARHITDFRMVQPLSRERARHPTEAWVLATPEGLAIAVRAEQPPEVPRTRQRAQRDQGGPMDRVNVYVDFDGDGRTGYNFTLLLSDSIIDTTITNENQFNDDWDGDWRHAVSEDAQAWYAEILLPWHIAPMRKADGGTRTIGLSLDRVIGATGERMAWPAVTFVEPRFLSALERVEIPQYSQSLLAVTPYVVGLYDKVGGETDFDAGADVFWKPSGQFQLSATLNPDFGQVESDELVVNFGAIETFFNDKRPFFTENQSYFDVPFGGLNGANRLIYTRRVGGAADDGSGAGDVRAAVKLNGSAAGFGYGVFAATEDDDAGRDFYALRATRDSERHGLGAMLTRVERPHFDRTADVFSLEHRWRPDARWNVRSVLVGSRVEQVGARVDDSGAQVRIDHELDNGWREQLFALHLGDGLQLNDFGFLERNDFNYVRYERARRLTDLPDDSPYNSHDWRFAVSHRSTDGGVHIADAFAIGRQSERRDGGNQYIELAGWTDGHDDLILRGNGVVRMPAKLFLFAERFRPRRGHWAWYGSARYFAEGLGGPDDGAIELVLEPTYHVDDRLSFFSSVRYTRNPDWLLWRGGNRLATFDAETLHVDAGMTWLVDDRQELRVRLEAIGLDARTEQVWRVGADRRARAVDEAVPDFALRTLGFQVRYRYELAPLSYLYVAYVRGGSMLEEAPDNRYDVYRHFGEAFDLRDSEQLLVKLSYRFEL
ncbi:DUF5916 domain-containing protein [Vulcaniibacterium thermophilum]|uniref:DUF5916 domain-containing protein n=2 Tax=Gammaproteobacteria TaxID=1236 RepID=A0A918Z3V1_9GAMM|nr:DUF5916 domain-containing protein [Vulcaniibacterium thermophilum]GHE32998.1 hypothetical protein GCM10007167_13830 [Vulcaniibacterium thermophilum]